ncbi:MAG TPA: alkyl hydroperoxide reductase, partial [Gemmatimonadota bacterium]|nr:alkyl hydroperoxide reductase [Gemmatimonadota bacterium]
MHMLPRVRQLEEAFGDALVTIGVHAGKYHHERRTAAIAEACRREGVRHPVVNDRQFRFWRANSVAAWPTITIVDPEGYVVAQQAGELPYDPLHDFVRSVIGVHEKKGTMDRTPWPLRAEPVDAQAGPLLFPGKVAADIEGRIAVADTGHHRVVLGHMLGNSLEVRAVIGSGDPGFADGSFAEARFREPQGLALAGDMLIVADRGNHAVRMVDLQEGRVATMAGTGRLGEGAIAAGDPLAADLRSPWDVLLHDYMLFVAMAGSHQIWRLDLREGRLAPHAGSGREEIADGPAP